MSPDPHNPAVEPTPPAPGWKEQYGPLIVKVAVAFAGILLAALAVRLGVPAPQIVVNAPAAEKSAPADGPKVVQGGDPRAVEGIGEGRLRRRIAANIARGWAIDRAVKDGIPVPGGGVRKVTREEAERLVKRIDDETITEGARVYGAPFGEGRLQAFFQWLIDHKEEIIAFILQILMLFGDEQPTGVMIVPADGGGALVTVFFASGRVVSGLVA